MAEGMILVGLLRSFYDTRIGEQGYPKATGLLRRKRILDESAVVQALADTVRLALALGSSFPDKALGVVAKDYCESRSRSEIEDWLDRAQPIAQVRQAALPDLAPWKRFVSIVATHPDDDEGHVIPWSALPGQSIYDVRRDSALVEEITDQVEQIAAAALAWAIRNQELARKAFEPTDEDVAQFVSGLGENLGGNPEGKLAPLLDSFSAFAEMAEEIIRRYEIAVGSLSTYADLQ